MISGPHRRKRNQTVMNRQLSTSISRKPSPENDNGEAHAVDAGEQTQGSQQLTPDDSGAELVEEEIDGVLEPAEIADPAAVTIPPAANVSEARSVTASWVYSLPAFGQGLGNGPECSGFIPSAAVTISLAPFPNQEPQRTDLESPTVPPPIPIPELVPTAESEPVVTAVPAFEEPNRANAAIIPSEPTAADLAAAPPSRIAEPGGLLELDDHAAASREESDFPSNEQREIACAAETTSTGAAADADAPDTQQATLMIPSRSRGNFRRHHFGPESGHADPFRNVAWPLAI